MSMKMKITFGVASILALGLGLALSLSVFKPEIKWDLLATKGVFEARPYRAIGPFQLVDQQGNAATEQIFKGRWSFIFVGYTSCPDVCPTTLSTFRELKKALVSRELEQDTAFMMVTADPERDTSSQLKAYLEFFDEDFIGLTGDSAVLKEFAKDFNAGFRVPKHEPGENYFVDHSSHISLIDPDGQFVAFFQLPHETALIADVFSLIKDQ